MQLNYEFLKTRIGDPVRQSYGCRETILYNLGVGANVIESPASADLSLVWERRLQALPTMATVLGEEPYWFDDARTGLDWRRSVHGEHHMEWRAPLPAEGEVIGQSAVEEVYDKGAGRGALLVTRRTLSDAASGRTIAVIRKGVFFRGQGGFGGPTAPAAVSPPQHAPELTVSLGTRPEQALLYRLSGDNFPLHVDPAFATEAGFTGPILHGLCTYAIAARAVIAGVCDGEAARLRTFGARFSAPVFPGETIETLIWLLGPGAAAVQCRVGERTVIDNARVEFDAAAADRAVGRPGGTPS